MSIDSADDVARTKETAVDKRNDHRPETATRDNSVRATAARG